MESQEQETTRCETKENSFFVSFVCFVVNSSFALTSERARGLARALGHPMFLAFAFWTVAGSAGEKPAQLFPGAVSYLGGLTLWATVPCDHYGPGQAVTILLTFQNKGNRAVLFQRNGEWKAVFLVDGKEATFPQEPAEADPVRSAGEGDFRSLAPGESWLTRLTVKPPRKEMLPGVYPLKVYSPIAYRLSLPGHGAGRPLQGTLASNEAHVKIKYDVMVVY